MGFTDLFDIEDQFLDNTIKCNKNEVSLEMKKKILIVDNCMSNVIVLEAMLKHLGYKDLINTAFSGDECIELCKENHYSCIFMDIHMSGINGYETSNWIRNNDNLNKETPIIGVTSDRDCIEACTRSGMQMVLYKPLHLRTMKEALNDYSIFQ
jgi:CheY-like chemotaxis protein